MSAGATPGRCQELDAGEEAGVDGVCDSHRRDEGRQRLAHNQLFATDRRRQRRLERALLPLSDDRGGGDRCRHERRDSEHVEQEMALAELTCI
jgi:hypothetical protein